MKYLIILLALIPAFIVGTITLHSMGFGWFDSCVAWSENAFSMSVPHPVHLWYYLSVVMGRSALWLLIIAFWISPAYTFLRFDLREFKKLLGGFAVGYAIAHLLFFVLAHHWSLQSLGNAMVNHLFLSFGAGALLILALSPLSKASYKLLYLGVVAVMIHLLLGYKTLHLEHIITLSLLTTAMALRLIKK
jgi:DMSO/TMAO reductase YedYZ heme-binding membrane subunit